MSLEQHGHEDQAPHTPEAKKMRVLDTPEMQAAVDNRMEPIAVESVLEKHGMCCVDGRADKKNTVGVVGGNLGITFSALGAVEALTKQQLTAEQIIAIVREHPDTFAMHTDTHALHALLHSISKDSSLAELNRQAPDEHSLDRLHKKGPANPATQSQLLELLTKPEYIGCGHAKQIISQKETDASGPYGIRPALAQAIMKAAYSVAWEKAGDHRVIDTLEGDHAEAAVVQFVQGEIRDGKTLVPTYQPAAKAANGETVQTFMNHPDIAAFCLQKLAPIVAKHIPALQGKEAEIVAEAKKLLDKQTGVTVSRLAKSRNLFEATFDPKNPTAKMPVKKVTTIE